MNISSLISKILPILIISSLSLNAGDNDPRKKAFNLGVHTAIKVISHEQSQSTKEIPAGYCLEVDPAGKGDEFSFSAIKLESIALYMGLSPSLFEFKNFNGEMEKQLCFGIFKGTEEEARNAIDNIRYQFPDVYKKIERFYPHITRISNPGIYKRFIPIVGELHEDKTPIVRNLARALENTKRYTKEIIDIHSKSSTKNIKYIGRVDRKVKKATSKTLTKTKEKVHATFTQMKNIQKKYDKDVSDLYMRIEKISEDVGLDNIKLKHVVVRYKNIKDGIIIKEIDNRVPRILVVEKIKEKKKEETLSSVLRKQMTAKTQDTNTSSKAKEKSKTITKEEKSTKKKAKTTSKAKKVKKSSSKDKNTKTNTKKDKK